MNEIQTQEQLRQQFLEEVLYPVVRVRTSKGSGSGTVVWSGLVDEKWETYVITNHHVIAPLIQVTKKYNSLFKRDMPKETRGTASVDFFQYPEGCQVEGALSMNADIVAYSADDDLALLKVRSKKEAEFVVNLAQPGDEADIFLSDMVLAVGSGMGNPPLITDGRINYMNTEIDSKVFWMSGAPIIFGNSGGAIFLERNNLWIGVPSRVEMAQLGWSIQAVPHIGYFIPFTRVEEWLDSQYYQFIFNTGFTAENCHDERQRAQDEAIRMADLQMMQERDVIAKTGQYFVAED